LEDLVGCDADVVVRGRRRAARNGLPAVAVDVDDVRVRRARSETWATIADELGVSVDT